MTVNFVPQSIRLMHPLAVVVRRASTECYDDESELWLTAASFLLLCKHLHSS